MNSKPSESACANHCIHELKWVEDGVCRHSGQRGICDHKCIPAPPSETSNAVSSPEFPLTEVAVDRDCVLTFQDKDYQLFTGQSFTIMLGKLVLTGPAERDGIPTIQQRNYAAGYQAGLTATVEQVEIWFREGVLRCELDIEKYPNGQSPCPYEEEHENALAAHWWTRGYSYAFRLFRAYKAEERLRTQAAAFDGAKEALQSQEDEFLAATVNVSGNQLKVAMIEYDAAMKVITAARAALAQVGEANNGR